MPLVRHALAEAERRLAAIPGQPRQDAALLMADALGVTVGELHLRRLDDPAPAAFEQLLARRLAGEPIPYITGRAGFWTIELEVGPGTLIPRADSETLLLAAQDHFGARAPARILDLGTGPGTLLLAALDQWPAGRGLGIDRSEAALAFARRNAERLALADRAAFRQGDWAGQVKGPFDLVLCNPPYIEEQAELPPDVRDWEPHEALYAGADGLSAYRSIARDLPRLIAPGGVACIELGEGQRKPVAALFAPLFAGAAPFTISSRSDLNDIPRCLVLRA